MTGAVHVPADGHAAADVEQHGETDRRLARIEIAKFPRRAAVNHLEIGFLEIADDAPPPVANGRRDRDDFNARLEDDRGLLARRPCRSLSARYARHHGQV